MDNLEKKLNNRKQKLDIFGFTVQPNCIIYGEPSNPEYLITVNDIHYEVKTGIRALELLFKLFHSVDIDYPAESEHVWLFIEKVVFKMKPKKVSLSASSVVADITFHLLNQMK